MSKKKAKKKAAKKEYYTADKPMSSSKLVKVGDQECSEYEIDSWVDTVLKAQEILSDPAKMKHVNARVEKKKAALTSFDEMKERVRAEG